MTDHMEEVNAGLREFRGAVHANATVGRLIRCCVVSFAEKPQVLLPLHSTASLTDLPTLELCAGTNFGPAFTLLREAIDQDVITLKSHKVSVHRPIVFFLSDGQPTDPVTWPAAYASLTDPAWTSRPNMIAYGLGDADQDTLARIGTFRTFLGRDGVRLATALIASVQWARPDRV